MRSHFSLKNLIVFLVSITLLGLLTLGGTVIFTDEPEDLPSNSVLGVSNDLRPLELSRDKESSVDILEITETGIYPGAVPALIEPGFDSTRMSDSYLADEALGIGLEINGEPRFYPNQILVWHSVINDVIEDTPVLISFCPFCSSSVVFSREVEGSVLTFQTSTKLWQDNLLMRDTNNTNNSLWSSLIGEAIYGPRTSAKLELLPSQNTTYAEWKALHPETKVLSTNTGYNRPYNQNPFENESIYEGFQDPHAKPDPRTFMVSFVYKDEPFAYSITKLAELQTATTEIQGDEVVLQKRGSDIVSIAYDNNTLTEQELEFVIAPLFVWRSLYPEGTIVVEK